MSDYTCRICSNRLNNEPFTAKEMMFGLRTEFIYFLCSKCQCLQINKVPDDISRYYSPGNYYSFKNKALRRYAGLPGLVRAKAVRMALQGNSLGAGIAGTLIPLKTMSILKGIAKNSNARILDVGCGTGWNFLYPLYKAGFRNSAGCDPYIEKDISYPEGLTIYKKELSEMEGEWDIITFHHSFEHIGNPHETIKKAYELLAPGGYCIIRIPTVSSFAWKHYGVNWFQLDAPRHIFLHSVESMNYLASENGFNLTRIIYDSTHHQFTISERYKSGRAFTERGYRNILDRISSLFQKMRNSRRAADLNSKGQGDQAAFFLYKDLAD
jgi:2-polyprenyl-3-methyl-5-hydroxy-6-metoxy-1,4-benzoquinol methylase